MEPITVPYVVGRAARAAIYRTHITHLRQTPVNHYFEHRSYSWYVDVDHLPELPRWLRFLARFDPNDQLTGVEGDTLRQRIDAFLSHNGTRLPGGRVTALLQPRVFGHEFNPLSLYWCHDRDGVLRHVVAEMHNIRGDRHAYLLPSADMPVMATKRMYVSPFHPVDGHYVIRAPLPGHRLDVDMSLHRGNQPAFVATMRGKRRPATVAGILWLQLAAPLAPMRAKLEIRMQAWVLRLRRVPRVPWQPPAELKPAMIRTVHIDVTELPGRSVAS